MMSSIDPAGIGHSGCSPEDPPPPGELPTLPRYQELHGELERRLLVMGERLRARIITVAAELGLTPQQAMLLRHLGQPQRMGDIATALGCDRSNVTGLVNRLAARKLVERVTDPRDQRSKYLVLTDDGQALRSQIESRLFTGSLVVEALAPGERHQLLLLLRKLTLEITNPEPE
jgi:DNA-binding MarR family transcriptional regulator